MRILYVNGNAPQYDFGLVKIVERTESIFKELGAETETLQLDTLHPPNYNGDTTSAMDTAMDKLKTADGVVFACTAQIFAPTALMQSFLEYLDHDEYSGILKDKHCMLIALSQGGGEKSALDYLSRVVSYCGGYSVSQIGLQSRHLLEMDGDGGDFVDKCTEDFYRAVHRRRKYIIPADFAPPAPVHDTASETPVAPPPDIVAEPVPVQPVVHKQLLNFSETEEKEIEELSALFSQKYTETPIAPALDAPVAPAVVDTTPVAAPPPSDNSVLALTEQLPQRFKSQQSSGLQATIQINITGSETFDGYLYIHSTECTFVEGTAPAPDIIIMADTAVWLDVLTGKSTAQKAFMIGGIKVRGDFVLLTKFDSLFETQK